MTVLFGSVLLFFRHAVETTVETGPDVATSSDDSTVHTYPKRYWIQKFPLWRADSKVSGYAGQIHRMHVNERRIREEKFADSKVSGYVAR